MAAPPASWTVLDEGGIRVVDPVRKLRSCSATARLCALFLDMVAALIASRTPKRPLAQNLRIWSVRESSWFELDIVPEHIASTPATAPFHYPSPWENNRHLAVFLFSFGHSYVSCGFQCSWAYRFRRVTYLLPDSTAGDSSVFFRPSELLSACNSPGVMAGSQDRRSLPDSPA